MAAADYRRGPATVRALAFGSPPGTDSVRLVSAEPAPPPVEVTMDEIVALCKRRGFIFPSSEIYGGLGSTYDYGHYGVLLKNNVKQEWWRAMIGDRDEIGRASCRERG